jgi:hypothetical protein
VDDVPIVSADDERKTFQQALGLNGPPAYMRRGRAVEEALEALLARCRRQRAEWLPMVRVRLALLHALAGEWPALRPWLGDTELRALAQMHDEIRPELRHPVAPTSAPRQLRQALTELTESIARFNERWLAYLHEVDLGPINELRDGYNRYYVIEKECALRSPKVARQGFVPLPAVTTTDLERLLPPLPVPRI